MLGGLFVGAFLGTLRGICGGIIKLDAALAVIASEKKMEKTRPVTFHTSVTDDELKELMACPKFRRAMGTTGVLKEAGRITTCPECGGHQIR